MVRESAEGGIILVLTVSPWDEPKRLRRQLTEVLSADGDVVYVTLPFGMFKPPHSRERGEGRIRVISLAGPPIPMRVLAGMPLVRSCFNRLTAWRLRRRLRSLGRIGAVFCFTPLFPDLLSRLAGVPLIYVANDDHAAMAGSRVEEERLRADEGRTIALCDRVISVSEVIGRRLARHGKPVHLFYPGHDCKALPLQNFEDVRMIRRSVCFLGYIDWRVDFDLLRLLLQAGWHVALIGPVIGTQAQVADLSARFPTSFELFPAVDSRCAPDMLAHYEVLIIPYRFRTAEQAEVMELPNKMFMYFSALRPVVTTWMPNLKLVEPGLVYRAANHQEFLELCLRAIAEDSLAHAARRQELARRNTWEARRADLRGIIDGQKAEIGINASEDSIRRPL